MDLEAKLFEKINKIYKQLKGFVDGYKIISRVELREKIKSLLKSHTLTSKEEQYLKDKFDLPPMNYIFLGSTKEVPDSINAPSLIEQVNYRDVTFYHGHTLATDEELMEKAIQRVYDFKEGKMQKILTEFLRKSGFGTKLAAKNKILATKKETKFEIVIYSSILTLWDEIKSLNLEENVVMAVPTGNNPGPYINFYKDFANMILLENAFVWIVNIEDESVSPLVGHPKDKELTSNFKSSDLARHAQRIIGMQIDEDF